MIRPLIAAAALAASPALADFQTLASPKPVAETMDALVAAVEGAGATVFARVDHAAGARSVEMELPEAQLLIFGNPRLGTPVMQDDLRAGLMLPLRVLVHDSDAGTVITWQDPVQMLDGMTIPEDAEYIARIRGALGNLTGAAVK